MRDLFKRFAAACGYLPPTAGALPQRLLNLLGTGRASDLRLMLQTEMEAHQGFPVAELLEQARLSGWDSNEILKLSIYADFFSGQSALGYQRLVQSPDAALDFDLFMTAMTHCYRHDKFVEAYHLIKSFKIDQAQRLDLSEYYPCAAYAAFSGGGTVQEAASYLERAFDEGLVTALVVVNAYVIFFEAGLLERLAESNRLIHNHFASDMQALFARGAVELARDYYPEGFRLCEARYHRQENQKWISPTLFRSSRWHREPLACKRLFIHGEQGVGDVVMMARYLPILEAQGVSVILECPDSVRALMEHNFPQCQLVTVQAGKEIEVSFDFWTGMMSLPFHFDTTANSVPATSGYLSAPSEQVAYWRDRVRQLNPINKPKIGIAWSGNPSHWYDRRRSIAFDKIWQYLCSALNVQFFALQTVVPLQHPNDLITVTDELVTFSDTAALIAEMDLVITVDTSTVHLAGALGKPTWLLLPYRYEWRWSLCGEGNNWYDSVKVLRQKSSGDWDSLLAEVFQERLPEWIDRQQKA